MNGDCSILDILLRSEVPVWRVLERVEMVLWTVVLLLVWLATRVGSEGWVLVQTGPSTVAPTAWNLKYVSVQSPTISRHFTGYKK